MVTDKTYDTINLFASVFSIAFVFWVWLQLIVAGNNPTAKKWRKKYA
jgi:hypothetical protein